MVFKCKESYVEIQNIQRKDFGLWDAWEKLKCKIILTPSQFTCRKHHSVQTFSFRIDIESINARMSKGGDRRCIVGKVWMISLHPNGQKCKCVQMTLSGVKLVMELSPLCIWQSSRFLYLWLGFSPSCNRQTLLHSWLPKQNYTCFQKSSNEIKNDYFQRFPVSAEHLMTFTPCCLQCLSVSQGEWVFCCLEMDGGVPQRVDENGQRVVVGESNGLLQMRSSLGVSSVSDDRGYHEIETQI